VIRDPLFSFVVPAYNVERYISKKLGSLLSQTDKDFEIIVVDDGSTDNTYNVAKEILEKSGFSNYTILRKPNGGVTSARNMGIKHAKGKYIIFLDGDDYVSPELVEKVKEVVSKSDVDMVCWKFQLVSEDGNSIKRFIPFWGLKEGQIYSGLQVLEKILIERSFRVWTSSAAYSKRLIIKNNLFYNENHYVGEDQEFTYKYLINSHRICFIDNILSYYTQRKGSITKQPDTKQFDAFLAIIEAQRYISNRLAGDGKSEASKLILAFDEYAVISFLTALKVMIKNQKWPSYKDVLERISARYSMNLMEEALSRARRSEKIIKLGFFRRIGYEIFKFSPKLFVYFTWVITQIKKE